MDKVHLNLIESIDEDQLNPGFESALSRLLLKPLHVSALVSSAEVNHFNGHENSKAKSVETKLS